MRFKFGLCFRIRAADICIQNVNTLLRFMELELYRESSAPVWVMRLEAEGGYLCWATATAKNTRRNVWHTFFQRMKVKPKIQILWPGYNLSQVRIQMKSFLVLKHTYIVCVFAFLWCDTNKTMWSDTGEPELVSVLNCLLIFLVNPWVGLLWCCWKAVLQLRCSSLNGPQTTDERGKITWLSLLERNQAFYKSSWQSCCESMLGLQAKIYIYIYIFI